MQNLGKSRGWGFAARKANRGFSSIASKEILKQLVRENKPHDIISLLKNSTAVDLNVKPRANGLKETNEIPRYFYSFFTDRSSKDDIQVAKDALKCVDKAYPFTQYISLVGLINKFLDADNVLTAWSYYQELASNGHILDVSTADKLVDKLCKNMMLVEAEQLALAHEVNFDILVKIMNPFVLTGRLYQVSVLLEKFVTSPDVHTRLGQVEVLVEKLLRARIRRSIAGVPFSTSEDLALKNIDRTLGEFQRTLEYMQSFQTEPAGLDRCILIVGGFVDYCRNDWPENTVPSPLSMEAEDKAVFEALFSLEPPETFKYLIEHRNFYSNDGFLEVSPFVVEDLTATMKPKAGSPALLYSSDFFPGALSDEQRFVSILSNDILDTPAMGLFVDSLESLSMERELLDGQQPDENYDDEYEMQGNIREVGSDDDDESDDDDLDGHIEFVMHSSRSSRSSRGSPSGNFASMGEDDMDMDMDIDVDAGDHVNATALPRGRLQDLSRSLFLSFGRIKPRFKDDFFDEMEVLSYEDPLESSFDVQPDDDGGVVSKKSALLALPDDFARFEK